MKKTIMTVISAFAGLLGYACDVCERQQPILLRGITHGGGPQSQWDYLIISVTSVIVLFSLFFMVKWLLRPGERSSEHIKYSILNRESHGR